MDEAFDWLLGLGVPVAWLGLLVWAGYTGRQGLLHYGILATGLLLAGMSFLLCLANAMTGEAWRGASRGRASSA